MRDTTEKLGRWRAACAFLAGVAVNVAATVRMVAYSGVVRRREAGRLEMRARLVDGVSTRGGLFYRKVNEGWER